MTHGLRLFSAAGSAAHGGEQTRPLPGHGGGQGMPALAAALTLLLLAGGAPTAGQDKPKPATTAKTAQRSKSGASAASHRAASAKRKQRGARAAEPARAEGAASAAGDTAPSDEAPDTRRANEARRASDPASARRADDPPAARRGGDAHDAKAPTTSANALADVDAAENVRREGGTEVKTLEFGGLDIEGQLKTPQMLYFLNRLRAEFDRPQLPHRSFIPELQRSTQENTF